MNRLDLGYVVIEYKEPIIYRRYTKPVTIGAKEVMECVEASEKLSNNKPYFVLADTRLQVDVNPEGRKAALDAQNSTHVIAQATLVKWLGQRLTANVVNELNKPPYPMEVFTDEDEAIKWLLKQRTEREL